MGDGMENVTLYYEFARARLESQDVLNRDYITRAYNTAALSVALAGVSVVILNLQETDAKFGASLLWSMIAFGVFFVVVAVAAFRVLWLSKWRSGPKENEFGQYAYIKSEFTLNWWAAETYRECIKSNRKLLKHKATCLNVGIAFVWLQSAALVAMGVSHYMS